MLSCQCCDLGFWKYSSTACSVSYHTCCTIFGNFKYFWAVCPAFFLQSGSVVLDCGQTPPQHAQCHITLAAQVQVFIFCLGSCLVAKESHIYRIPMLHCSTKEANFQDNFLQESNAVFIMPHVDLSHTAHVIYFPFSC